MQELSTLLPSSGYPAEPIVARICAHPGVQRVPSPKLTLFVCKNFFDPALCTELMELIDARRRPSTVSDYNGDDAFRTSETCDLEATEAAVAEVNRRIGEFTGLDLA
jgi:prolyl 4-hydroxylase